MSFFGGSPRLADVGDFMPKRKKRNGKNGRDITNGRGAKESAMGFEAPEFFGGLRQNGNGSKTRGVPKADPIDLGVGLQIPELGQGFNSRIGNIGSGFVENVDTFKIGFRDVLTGNGRTGEIIKGRTGLEGQSFDAIGGKRKRGRPKGSGKKQKQKAVSKRFKSKTLDFDTKGASEIRKEAIQLAREGRTDEARQKLAQIETKTVGSLLKEKGRGAFTRSGVDEDDFEEVEITSERDPGGLGTRSELLEKEGEIDEEQVERFREKIAVERAGEGALEEAVSDEVEDEENGLDEDLEEVNEDDFAFEVEEGQIRRK